MSLQTYVFYTRDKRPDRQRLQCEIERLGYRFTLPEDLDPAGKDLSCIRARFEDLPSDFDYLCIDYSPDDWDWLPDTIQLPASIQVVSMFNTNSNAQEIVGMMLTAAAIARATGGLLYSEFFADELVAAEQVDELVHDIIEQARGQFCGPSRLRSPSR